MRLRNRTRRCAIAGDIGWQCAREAVRMEGEALKKVLARAERRTLGERAERRPRSHLGKRGQMEERTCCSGREDDVGRGTRSRDVRDSPSDDVTESERKRARNSAVLRPLQLGATGEADRQSLRGASVAYGLLQSVFAREDCIEDANWLTSTLIDLMLWRLATQYPQVHFLATDFCHLHLPSVARDASSERTSSEYQVQDILGRHVDYASAKPIVFVANVGHIHWNLLRVQLDPHPELQLFEPMGRLSSRSGVSYRTVPRYVFQWLDTCYPQHKSWLERSVSAITKPQQVSGFDCGVACLLYADKCGQGQPREAINDSTDQEEITTFRSELQRQLQTAFQVEATPGVEGVMNA